MSGDQAEKQAVASTVNWTGLTTAIRDHVLAVYPEEAVGAIVAGEYVPLENVAPDMVNPSDPTEHNRVTGFEVADPVMDQLIMNPEFEALIHSHPQGQDCPSRADMQSQQDGTVPWGIAVISERSEGPAMTDLFYFGDQLLVEPLVGRQFRHGVHDCYALVRDWMRIERGIVLPNFPRMNDWWTTNANVIEDNLEHLDWELVDPSEMDVGDWILMSIQSTTINHMGVYVGKGAMLHHLPRRLSRKEPVNGWYKQIQRVIRVSGAKE